MKVYVKGGGGLSNPMPDTTLIANLNADLLDGVHLADIRLGQNILHNWDFRNPINQRGIATGWVPGNSYTYDRWLMTSRVWMASGTSVNLTVYDGTPEYIDQRIEQDLRGRTYTLSVDLLAYGIKSVVLNYPANGAETGGEYNGLFLSLVREGPYDRVRIVNWNPNVEYPIKRVKLELGPVSTLHLDPPMDHAVELPKCQRFFRKDFRTQGNCVYASSGGVIISIPFDNPFRIGPTISIPSYTSLLVCPNVAEYTPTSHMVSASSIRHVMITFVGTFTGVNYGAVIASTVAGRDMSMSADL